MRLKIQVTPFINEEKKNLCHALSPSRKNATQITALILRTPYQIPLREHLFYKKLSCHIQTKSINILKHKELNIKPLMDTLLQTISKKVNILQKLAIYIINNQKVNYRTTNIDP